MKPGLLISTVLLPLTAACSIALAAPAPAATPATAETAAASISASAPEAAAAPAPEASTPVVAAAPLPAMPAGPPMTLAAPASSAGSLLQTIFALIFVLALLMGLAWFMKRYGAKAMGSNAKMRVVSSLSLGGRERVVLIEVADQWIVVGASPGRVNALATLPRQEGDLPQLAAAQNGPAAASFSEWLKQTVEKRNGK
ncbi:MAG: flagellar biosynthetic protein FliO [Pseudomonadota bacterium]|jgi:flagellar protein FliO/FliZ